MLWECLQILKRRLLLSSLGHSRNSVWALAVPIGSLLPDGADGQDREGVKVCGCGSARNGECETFLGACLAPRHPLCPTQCFSCPFHCHCTHHRLPSAAWAIHVTDLQNEKDCGTKDILPMLFLCLFPGVQVASVPLADAYMGG